jgi:hypothetical protein
MNELKVIGRERIGQIEFTGIEGGFGEGKKAMLVKDIATIHGTTIKRVNELINRNRKRFKDSVDVIDLKQVVQNDLFSDYGFTKAEWGNANNIYLLSERGYSKLLKILEDDKAWEVYDQLVDNYFNQRQAIRENQPSLVTSKRLEIMEENAKTRRGSLLMKIAMATKSESSREMLLADAAEAVTGRRRIPAMKQAEYSAEQVAKKLGVSSGNMVGRICNILGLKAKKPEQNEYGRWAMIDANGERPTWVYFDKGVAAIRKEAVNLGKLKQNELQEV